MVALRSWIWIAALAVALAAWICASVLAYIVLELTVFRGKGE